MQYPIFNIPDDASNTIIEQLGTKKKFWFYDKNDNNRIKLFKIGRSGTGENWAEKVTSELAKLLNLPCAAYDFAVWKNIEGVISPLFLPQHGSLIHGNEILVQLIENYPSNKSYKVPEYKLTTVLDIISTVLICDLPLGYKRSGLIKKPLDLFIGYLMFDCWISNPDRHHENWGFVFDGIKKKTHLAPSYDHASGLGCRVSDKERIERLNTKDTRYNVDGFVKRAKSAFYDNKLKQLKTIDAFSIATDKADRQIAYFWINKLEHISQVEIKNIFKNVPNELISKPGIDFALAILEENKNRLLHLKNRI